MAVRTTTEANHCFFEDWEIGRTSLTPRRMVTQTDITNFACLSGDFNAPHVDWEFCKGMTGGLAFDQAVNAVALGREGVAFALGVNFENAAGSADPMMSSTHAVGDIDFHTVVGFRPIAWYAMDAVRYMHDYDGPLSASRSAT